MSVIFIGCLVRFLQSLFLAAPTILVGLVVAGIFARLMGQAGMQKLFAAKTRRSLLQSWAIGMLLPVCSLGAIPVARQMRAAGIAGGVTLAFAITAPLFNPLSLLYGLTLSQPWVIMSFAAGSLAVVTIVGVCWDKMFSTVEQPQPQVAPVSAGPKRLLAIGAVAARELAGRSGIYMLIGLLGVAALAAVLPAGSLQTSAERDDPWAPARMTAVAVPAYATPMLAMSQLGPMFQHGNSIGAAFALLALGAGMNLGLLAWAIASYGWKRGLALLGLLLLVVLALSYGVEKPLHESAIEPAGHTHAFDIYCSPFVTGSSGLWQSAQEKIESSAGPAEILALAVLAVVLATGLALRFFDPQQRLEAWLERPSTAASTQVAWYNVHVPGTVIGEVMLLGLVAFSLVGCYAYYPSQEEAFQQLRIANVELMSAASRADREAAEYQLPLAEDWTRRLQVGAYLRKGELSLYRQMKARIYLEKLELLEHALDDDSNDEVVEHSRDVERAYRRLRVAFHSPS